jgi:hypothetical protein
MANSSVLELVKAFAREYALPPPAIIQGGGDAGALQLRELLMTVGEFIWEKTNWQECSIRSTFTSVAGEDQGLISTLFPRQFAHIVPNTFWNVTARIKFTGPVLDANWQNQKALMGTSPLYRFKIYGGRLYVTQTMPAGHELSLFYKSRSWITDGVDLKPTFTADTDSSVFSDRLMKLGLRAFWLRIKQMPHRFEMEQFEDAVAAEGSINTIRPIMSLDEGTLPTFGIAIPLGGWTVP